jgi:hypothetical protein
MRAIPFLLFLGVAMAVARVAPVEAATGTQAPRTSDDSGALRVWIYVVGPRQLADHLAAQAIADRLLQTAGVAVKWRMCGATNVCSRATDASPNVTLILTPAVRPSCGTAALERGGLSATVLISLSCIDQIIFKVGGSPWGRSNPLLSTLEAYHLTGAAIAHEIGHVLGLRHTPSGIMRARLDTDDILALRRGQLGFRPTEVAAMRTSTMWQGLLAARKDDGATLGSPYRMERPSSTSGARRCEKEATCD